MPKIHRLSPHEAQKIAAGEVVDRPANVVKELVENAIDAGATTIIVYIEDGGKKLIRVIDNGCGLDHEDALLAFVNHATSKIKSVDDLSSISTFGFRGEALSSIAAVSKVTMTTKEDTASQAFFLSLDQGTITQTKMVSANTGTDIAVHDIFFNVPARQKFLKASETEWRQIQQLMYAICLDYLTIHIKVFHEDKLIINCLATNDLLQRVAQLWEHTFASNMLPFTTTSKDTSFTIHGAISNHQYMRYDRSSLFFFVNKRWVKHQKLTSALLKGYLNVIQPGRYPAGCIFIEINPSDIDVNIHPRKEEVQFLHPRKIEIALQDSVKETLEQHLSAQLKKPITFAPASLNDKSSTFSNTQTTVHSPEQFFNFDASPFKFTHAVSSKESFDELSPSVKTIVSSSISNTEHFAEGTDVQNRIDQVPVQENEHYTILGQFDKTYILLEKEDGLFIIDQHAAHERVLYELFADRFIDKATVTLLFPQIISLSSNALAAIEPHLSLLQDHGIGCKIAGSEQLIIHATPVHLKNQSLQDVIIQMIHWIEEFEHVDNEQFKKVLNEKLQAQMACKAAVKAGDVLTTEQMEQLLKDLYKTPHRFTCPHGRPTGWLLSTYELEKKFKRKL